MRVPARTIVETRCGTFDFVGLPDVGVLIATIRRFAPHATVSLESESERLLPPTDEEILGNARLYTYRNRTARALLWLPFSLALVTVGATALQAAGWLDVRDVAARLAMVALLALFALWAWWRYRTVSIRTDELGVTWSGPGKRLFIPWSEVISFDKTCDVPGGYVLKGSRARIFVWDIITDFRALQSEVAARAPIPVPSERP